MKTTTILGQPSWQFASDRVEATLTRTGGHLAPVRFHLPSGQVVEPYSVAPWAEERPAPGIPPMLQAVRGDFFCAPFGGNDTVYQGEQHPPHGEAPNQPWKLLSIRQQGDETSLHAIFEGTVRPGRIDKTIHLRSGETNLYCQHVLSGMSGRMNPGHHANIKFPDAPGSGLIDTSPVRFAQVFPGVLEDAAKGGYSALQAGAVFTRLDRVPLANGGFTDASRYPARRGYEDILMLVHEARPDFAWTAVTFPAQRYVWFALKDPRVLRSTVCWISNGGRHYPPWNGRHVNVMGLEDVTANFHYGLAESARANPLTRRGIPTCLTLRPDKPLTINYIMGVAEIPGNFTRVKAITTINGGIQLTSKGGAKTDVPVDSSFLYITS